MREFVFVTIRGESAQLFLWDWFRDVLNGDTAFESLLPEEQDMLVSLSDALASASLPQG